MARPRDLAIVAALAAAATTGCKPRDAGPARERSARAPTGVPRAQGAIAIDGEGDEPDWPARAFHADFVDRDGQLARPSSELRALHDDDHVYVALYAADEDIRSTDAFELVLGDHAVRVDAAGAVTPAIPGARAAVDRDGTLDDARDDDEEWVIELAVPFAAIGTRPGEPLDLHARRCDTPKDRLERCGTWQGRLVLE